MAPAPTKPIPSFRRVAINDPSEMPDVYSSTPGGTLFSTTPGGSRIVYDRKFLMNLRDSPLSKTPPKIDFDVMPKVTGLDLLRKDQVFRSNVRRDVAVAADANNNAAANDSANLDDVQKQEKGKGSALFSQFEMEL